MENKKQNEFLKAYNKCHDEFIRYCSVLTYGKMDVEDLVQEALLSAYQNFDKIEDGKLLHYLVRAARNISIGQWRKSQHELKFVARHNQRLKDNGALPEILTDVAFLYEALAKLPEHQGEAIILSEVSGFSMKEIAELQNSTAGAVRAKICRGKKKLRALLEVEPMANDNSVEKRSWILLFMIMKEKGDDLFKSLKDAPTELSREEVAKIIRGFPDASPTPPEPDVDKDVQKLLGNINLNSIFFAFNAVVLLGVFVCLTIPGNDVEDNSIRSTSGQLSEGFTAEDVVTFYNENQWGREEASKLFVDSILWEPPYWEYLEASFVVENLDDRGVIHIEIIKEEKLLLDVEKHRMSEQKVVFKKDNENRESQPVGRQAKSGISINIKSILVGLPLLTEPDIPITFDNPMHKRKVYTSLKEALKVDHKWVYRLDLGDENLKVVPDTIQQFINLEELHLNGNQLKSVPEFIGYFSELRILYLYNNKLASIPESIGGLSNLELLSLTRNQLIKLPKSISQLSSLNGLYLCNNILTEIPESIGELSKLTCLNLERNQLTHIPGSMRQLTKLAYFMLGYNPLKEIPAYIWKFPKLRELHLDRRQLHRFLNPMELSSGGRIHHSLKTKSRD